MVPRKKDIFDLYLELDEALQPKDVLEFVDYFKGFTDKRYQPNCLHLFYEVIVMVFFAILGGCNTFSKCELFCDAHKEELKKYLSLPNGIPSHDTMQRCFSIIKTEELERVIVDELYPMLKRKHINTLPKEQRNAFNEDIINIDGKVENSTYRRSSKKGELKSLQYLNVYSTTSSLCLYTIPIDDKTNEIPVSQDILKVMDLNKVIVTCDALNTQKEFVSIIIDNKGDYCLALKRNHQTIYEDIETYFLDSEELSMLKKDSHNYYKEVSKEKSQVITREYYQSSSLIWFIDKESWKGLKSIGMCFKTIQDLITGEVSYEKRYYICSFKDDVKLMSACIRKHWNIENNLHWNLDYTFKCDDCTVSDKKANQNFNIVKKIALALIKQIKHHYKLSLENIRYIFDKRFNETIELIFKEAKLY